MRKYRTRVRTSLRATSRAAFGGFLERAALPCVAFAVPLLALAHCSLDGLIGGTIDGGAEAALDAPSSVDEVGAEADASAADTSGATDAGDGPLPDGDGGHPCSVHADDSRLYCSNTANAAMYSATSYSASVINYLRTDYSYFDCWGTGEVGPNGHVTWYLALGDDNPKLAWVPSSDVHTPPGFDDDPGVRGLPKCQ